MALGLKEGRPEQDIRGSYRPITIQEIPAKGFEASLARHYDLALTENPLHPIMAYRKGHHGVNNSGTRGGKESGTPFDGR